MTNGRPPRDPRRATALQPPEAVLYLQLSRRRRVTSVLLAGGGLVLAILLVAYGVTTQKSWPLGAALAIAVAGFASMWWYQNRVRPLQTIEDKSRANALFDAFDGRLDLGRLALTNGGVELDGKVFSWAQIHTIEATMADAMAKRATLVLDATHAKRRVALSLAGLPEMPGVVYSVMKMLWMRQVTAQNIAEFLPRLRPARFDVPRQTSGSGSLWVGIGMFAAVAGLFGALKFVENDLLLFALLSAVAGAGVAVWSVSRSKKADSDAAAHAEDRAADLQERGAGTDVVIRRKPVRKWPTIITVLFILPAIVFFAMGDWPFATMFLMFGSTVSLIAWLIAWWLGSGTIATLTSTGIVLGRDEIPWSAISGMDLHFLPRIETGQLQIRLLHARAPRTAGERINSTLSGGRSDREIVVSLARSSEPAATVFAIAKNRWEAAIGERKARDLRIEEFRTREDAQRKWKDFSAEEKGRSLFAGVAIVAVAGFAVHGVAADFRVSDAWLGWSVALSTALTVWGCVALMRSGALISARNGPTTPSYLASFLLVSLIVGGTILMAIGRSWPDLATQAWGREVSREVSYDKTGFRDAKRCPFPLALHLDGESRTYRFCTQEAAFAALPAEGTLSVRLRETWFGVHIVSLSTIGN